MEVFKEFVFDAAHRLADAVPPGHRYARLHGHSFHVEVVVRGTPDPTTGWIIDFAAIETAIQQVRAELDHTYLNEIDGLAVPTLENLSQWIWHRLQPQLPGLHRVVIRRGRGGEGCSYQPDAE